MAAFTSHYRSLATGRRVPVKLASGPTLTPRLMVRRVREATAGWRYDAVTVGYPGPVVRVEVLPVRRGRSAVHEPHRPLNRLRHGVHVGLFLHPAVLPDRETGDRRDGRQKEDGAKPDKRSSPPWSAHHRPP